MQASQSKKTFLNKLRCFLFVCLFFKASGQYNHFILFELKMYFSLSSVYILLQSPCFSK